MQENNNNNSNIYLSFTQGQRANISKDNPLGRTEYTLEKILDILTELRSEIKIKGIGLQRFCGSLWQGRTIGENFNGDPIRNMTVGVLGEDYWPTDEDFDIIREIESMGYDVICYVGFPTSSIGIMALENWPFYSTAKLAIDMSGYNKASQILIDRGIDFIIEPYRADILSYSMAGYITKQPDLPTPGSHIAYNGNPNSPHYYNPSEAKLYSKLPYDYNIHIPFRIFQKYYL